MNDNVVSLEERRHDGWNSGTIKCMNCAHEWAGVSPTGTVFHECSECGSHKGVRKHPASLAEGEKIWTCNCGCEYFFMSLTATRCASCGKAQNF